MHSPTSDARMETERQVLARMDHPNIARIFDAGRTEDGRPYFVMEYVPGKPITQWFDAEDLALEDRLELFEKVCLAVQHAHHKGVIHRDLKPSNILVMDIDGTAEVRVIDFGIAKAVEVHTEATLDMVTMAGQIVGTPSYMSPEQIAGSEFNELDTRSDVYSLGVLLYELLTRTTPFDRERLAGVGLASLARIICEEEPARPSTRVLDAKVLDEHTARQIAGHLRGELDWVVLRAMEKDPDRRYQSARALAVDVRRFLRNEPLEAGPPSGLYRFNKFARRHRGEMTAVAVGSLALIAFVVLSVAFGITAIKQNKATEIQLDRARELAAFSSTILDGIDPAVARGEDTKLLLQVLKESAERIDKTPPSSLEAAVDIRAMLGRGMQSITAFDEAERQFRIALDLSQSLHGTEHARTLELRSSLAESLIELSRYAEARSELDTARYGFTALQGTEGEDTLGTEFVLGMIDRLEGNYSNARAVFANLLPRFIATHGSDHPQTMSVRNSLGTVLSNLGEHDAAAVHLNEVIAFQISALGEDHPHLLATRNNLADIYGKQGRITESIELLETILSTKRRILPVNHPSLLISLNNLASTYKEANRYDEAESMLREALEASNRTLGPKDIRTLILTNNLAEVELLLENGQSALERLPPAIAECERNFPADHPLLFALLRNNFEALLLTGQLAEAESAARALVKSAESASPPQPERSANSRFLLGRALVLNGRFQEARIVLETAYELSVELNGQSGSQSIEIAQLLVEVQEQLDNQDSAGLWRQRSQP